QRRHPAEERERLGIERPHFRCDARAVIVDEQRSGVVEPPEGMTGEVDLAHCFGRQRCEIRRSPPAVVARADVNVVHIAQTPAPARGAPGPAPPRFRATGPCREATRGSRGGSRRDKPARFLRPGSSRCAPRTTPRRDALRGLPDGGESATRPRPWPGSSRVFAAEGRANPKLAPDQEAVVLPPWILEQSPA